MHVAQLMVHGPGNLLVRLKRDDLDGDSVELPGPGTDAIAAKGRFEQVEGACRGVGQRGTDLLGRLSGEAALGGLGGQHAVHRSEEGCY